MADIHKILQMMKYHNIAPLDFRSVHHTFRGLQSEASAHNKAFWIISKF